MLSSEAFNSSICVSSSEIAADLRSRDAVTSSSWREIEIRMLRLCMVQEGLPYSEPPQELHYPP
jgi:hypothetical protein